MGIFVDVQGLILRYWSVVFWIVAQVIEIESLGVKVRNTKRFMVLNPTGVRSVALGGQQW